jgi:hypothetical protein
MEAHGERSDELDTRRYNAERQRHDLRILQIDQQYSKAPGDPAETQQKIDALSAEITQLDQGYKKEREAYYHALMNMERCFVRPQVGLAGLLSRWLGPVPRCMVQLDADSQQLADVPSYRKAGLGLFVAAAVCLVALSLVAPWLAVSPAFYLYQVYASFVSSWVAIGATVLTGVVFVRYATIGITGYAGRQSKFFDRAAMYEEQWFRSGAESWSLGQRIYSCVAFGAVHIVNFIYPLTSLIVVGAVGGVFMYAYLREYRRSENYQRATVAAAKLHAAYNRFAVAYMAVALCVLLAASVL